MRFADVADPETLLRLIQSVPSPEAEPIKLWLAKVGYERFYYWYIRLGKMIVRIYISQYYAGIHLRGEQ